MSAQLPLWFLRLTHTRLADAILELCGVPQKESLRKLCLQLFTRSSACAPGSLAQVFAVTKRARSNSFGRKDSNESESKEDMDVVRYLDRVVESQGLPRVAADRLLVFLSSNCLPLPPDINDALDAIHESTGRLKLLDAKKKADSRKLKRNYEDIWRALSALRRLVRLMKSVGIAPIVGDAGSTPKEDEARINRPLYISLDLGLRQRRKHFHGQTYFQAVLLPDSYFDNLDAVIETNDVLLSDIGKGTKVAEGGRYDDLVRTRFS